MITRRRRVKNPTNTQNSRIQEKTRSYLLIVSVATSTIGVVGIRFETVRGAIDGFYSINSAKTENIDYES